MDLSIEDWCKKLSIRGYDIKDDGSVDVIHYFVDITKLKLEQIPIQFGIVVKDFYCYDNNLTSLKGSPKKIFKDFYCHNNKLETLEYISPFNNNTRISCYRNKLVSLKGCSDEVDRFHCHDNKLESLIGGPKICNGLYDCSYNKLTSLEGGPLKIGGGLNCERNPVYNEYKKFDNYEQYIREEKIRKILNN